MKPSVKPWLLIIGIAGIGFNLYYKYDRYYLGEQLIEKQIIINDPPELVETWRGGIDRYTLSGEGYKCKFWISEGGLSIVRDDDNIENKIKSIKKGEVIRVKIRHADESKIQSESARPRIIELSINQETLIKANEVEARDKKWYRINFGFPIAVLVIWLIIQIRQILRRRRNKATPYSDR